MKKPSTRIISRVGKLQDQQLTIGLELGDRSSFYCVLNGAGEVILEDRVTTSPEAMKKTFEKMPRSRIALDTGTSSPTVNLVRRKILAEDEDIEVPEPSVAGLDRKKLREEIDPSAVCILGAQDRS